MGSGSTQTQQTQSPPSAPPWLRKLLKGEVSQWEQAQGSIPQLGALYGEVPREEIPNLTSQELNSIQQLEALGMNPGQMNAQEQAAANQLNQFLGQQGPSAATQAALSQFQQLQAPLLESQGALAGVGSGGIEAALAQGQESALVPFLQQDEQNKFMAAQDLQGLGNTLADRQRSDIANALQAAGMPRDIATQQAQALFNQLEQKFQFAQGVQTAPFGMLNSLIGGGRGTSVTTPPKF